VVFLEVDLSRAEERVELMLGRDPRDIELARSRDVDSYVNTAARIYGVAPKDVTKEQRYIAKRTRLAMFRGLAGARLSDELLKEGLVYTTDECSRWLMTGHAEHPAIEGRYFADVRKQVFRHRALANTWGRIIRFDDDRLSDELYRQAYSFLPQSEVADLMNQWGLVPLWRALQPQAGALWKSDTIQFAKINAQIHDALLLSCHAEDTYDIAVFLRDSLERPRFYLGEPLTIPITFKLGSTWKGSVEFSRLPSRDDFTDAALQCEKEAA